VSYNATFVHYFKVYLAGLYRISRYVYIAMKVLAILPPIWLVN